MLSGLSADSGCELWTGGTAKKKPRDFQSIETQMAGVSFKSWNKNNLSRCYAREKAVPVSRYLALPWIGVATNSLASCNGHTAGPSAFRLLHIDDGVGMTRVMHTATQSPRSRPDLDNLSPPAQGLARTEWEGGDQVPQQGGVEEEPPKQQNRWLAAELAWLLDHLTFCDRAQPDRGYPQKIQTNFETACPSR